VCFALRPISKPKMRISGERRRGAC